MRSRSSRSTRRPRRRSGRRITYLSETDVAYALHELARDWFPQEQYGEPMPDFKLRGEEGLNAFLGAVQLPRQPYYRTKHEKAAALFRSLIKNHPLVDGNKRLGVVALDVFLTVNRADLKLTKRQVVEAALAIAEYPGNFPLQAITRWVRLSCTGRPRKLVAVLAEGWPHARAYFMAKARVRDQIVGEPARVPGRRVRVATEIRELVSEELAASPEAEPGTPTSQSREQSKSDNGPNRP